MGHYNFARDLENAKLTEKEVSNLLFKHLGRNPSNTIIVFPPKGKFQAYDVKFRNTDTKEEITFEIKEDFYCSRSGNVAFEYESRGKPSGLVTSTADYIVYKVHTKDDVLYLLFKADKLKEFLSRLSLKEARFVTGGDKGSNTRMLLIPLDKVRTIAEEFGK